MSTDKLVALQSRPDAMRNICILAHVDHGKTTLSDCLLASNGIISQNLQGQIRYLDSRPDEQQRGITMEASAISLYFRVARKADVTSENSDQEKEKTVVNEYLINLIDSPGHIDFSSEVSTASRLCDGALVLVDVVEGVCSQTVTVLRQTWTEKIKPILVLNKIDRLVTDLKLTPHEAYIHMAKLIEQVNAVIGSFFAGDRMEEDMRWRELIEQQTVAVDAEFVESSDEDIYFAPEKNNVVFASAVDGWGFNVSQFAAMYERKLGIKREKLEKVLWGDFFYEPKTKKVVNKAPKKTSKPLFVQLVLENIWQVYESTVTNRDNEKVAKIVEAMGLRISRADITSREPRSLMSMVFNQWVPLSRSILLSVIDIVPTPVQAQSERMQHILSNTPGGGEDVDARVKKAMQECDGQGPLTMYVSKVMAVRKNELPTKRAGPKDSAAERLAELRRKSQRAREAGEDGRATDGNSSSGSYGEDDNANDSEGTEEVVVGVGRVFSGTIRVGQQVKLLGPKYSSAAPDKYCDTITVTGLYMLMGRDLVWLDSAGAGSIVGVAGLDGKIVKSGTLVDTDNQSGPNLAASSNVAAPPILRVAIEPEDPTQLAELEQGLKLLNMSDPCVHVSVQENGEHILATAGELHLERCIRDLKDRFARIEVQYSAPVVPFRETISNQPAIGSTKDKSSLGIVETTVNNVRMKIAVFPLDVKVQKYLVKHADIIKTIVATRTEERESDSDGIPDADDVIENEELDDLEPIGQPSSKTIKQDKERLARELDDLLKNTGRRADQIACFGPRKVGSNILFAKTGPGLFGYAGRGASTRSSLEENIQTGFQLAMAAGPLCGEPVSGVGCEILELTEEKIQEEGEEGEKYNNVNAAVHRRVISTARELIHQGIADWSGRIMLAQYLCDIQATTEVLGKVYGVVTRRRGKILSEEMKEGTPFFSIHASIPVVEAFGFSEEIRKRTSGAANPQLVFSGFETYEQDPFWVPTTEEELEELGELADKENVALSYVTKVRRRKGLPTHEKVVENAERQRTLKR